MPNKVIVAGIDPGPTESAFVEWDGKKVLSKDDMDNVQLLNYLEKYPHIVAIERIRGFGMKAGNEIFDTVEWIGRFHQAKRTDCYLVPRKAAIVHLCGTPKGNDPAIRKALIYRIGEQGTKKNPGPLFGVTKHKLPALAIAVTFHDLINTKEGLEIISKTPQLIKNTPVAA